MSEKRSKKEKIEVVGTVVEALPSIMFRMELVERPSGIGLPLWQDAEVLCPQPTWGVVSWAIAQAVHEVEKDEG